MDGPIPISILTTQTRLIGLLKRKDMKLRRGEEVGRIVGMNMIKYIVRNSERINKNTVLGYSLSTQMI